MLLIIIRDMKYDIYSTTEMRIMKSDSNTTWPTIIILDNLKGDVSTTWPTIIMKSDTNTTWPIIIMKNDTNITWPTIIKKYYMKSDTNTTHNGGLSFMVTSI